MFVFRVFSKAYFKGVKYGELPRLVPDGIPHIIYPTWVITAKCVLQWRWPSSLMRTVNKFNMPCSIGKMFSMGSLMTIMCTFTCNADEPEGGISKMNGKPLGAPHFPLFQPKLHLPNRTGTLWEGRFKILCHHAEEVLFYLPAIYRTVNPVIANIGRVIPADLQMVELSFFHAQEVPGSQSELWQPHELYLKLSRHQETRRSVFSKPYYK